MSAIYFHAAMALVNARSVPCGVFFISTPKTQLRYERRCQIFSFIGRKLYTRLGQE